MKQRCVELIRIGAKNIYRFFRLARDYPEAYNIYHAMVINKKENTSIFYLIGYMGDIVYGLTYVNAFKLQHPNQQIVFITEDKYKWLVEKYSGIDRAYYVESDSKECKQLFKLMMVSVLAEMGRRRGLYNLNPLRWNKCYHAENNDVLYQLWSYIYEFNQEPDIVYPKIDICKIEAIEDFYIKKNKIVVLNPYSNTTKPVMLILFERICEYLVNQGYEVYTNVIKEQLVVKGSKELKCSIDEFFSIAKEIPLVISIRSGILDYIVSSNVNMFIIYNQIERKFISMYKIKGWKCSGKSNEVNARWQDEDTIFNKFIQWYALEIAPHSSVHTRIM